MFLAGRTQMVSHMSYDGAVNFYLDMGFEGVELNNVSRDFSLREEFFDPAVRNKLKSVLRDSRLKGFSVGSHMNYVFDDNCYDAIILSMDTANELGTDIVIINGAKSEDSPDEWKIMRDRTASLCREAEKRGIKLCKEFEPNFICHSTAQLLELINEIDSPALYANLDLGHVFLEDENPLAMVEQIGPRIAHCHIENMAAGIHNHLPFDQGDMVLSEYIGVLKKVNFKGQLSFDYYNENYVKECPRSIEQFKVLTANYT
jgi:sugar phosphate isomerase/epimerase